MQLAVRFILPLVCALAVVAAVAQPLFNRLTVQWFVRDLNMRSTLIASAIEEPVLDLIRQGQHPKAEAFLERITQDERLYAIGICDRQGVMMYKTLAFPAHLPCPEASDTGRVIDHPRGLLHIAARSINADGGAVRSRLVLLHDMTFVQRRGEVARQYLFWMFMVVGVMLSAITVAIAQLSRRGWIAGLRSMLRNQRTPAGVAMDARRTLSVNGKRLPGLRAVSTRRPSLRARSR